MSPADLKAVETLKALVPGDKLEHGRTYYAKILLTGLEAMFAKPADLAAKLTAAGFVGVLVSEQPIDAVPDRQKFPSGSTFWARGVWAGQDKQLGGGAVPPQVRAIWLSPSAAVDVEKLKGAAAPAAARDQGQSLKTLLLVGGALYLLRKDRGRRLLGRLGLRRLLA